MFGSNVANSSFLRIDDASLSKPPLIPFSSYAVEETNGLFVMSVVLPINSTSLTYAGLYSRTEKRTLRSVTLGFYVLAASPGGNEDLPTHLFGAEPSSLHVLRPTPVRSIELRNCKFENCEISMRNGVVTQTTPTGFSFGNNNNNTTTSPSLFNVSNSMSLKITSYTMLLSEVTTCKEIRMNPDAFSNAQKPWLPCFPGTTLIRSLNQNVQIAMTWNWFDMRFSNKMYWLYERRDRLIFKTILMIRKFRSTALSLIDMNVIRLIFDLIAIPVPIMLTTDAHLSILQNERAKAAYMNGLIDDGNSQSPYLFANMTASGVLGPRVIVPEMKMSSWPNSYSFGTGFGSGGKGFQFGGLVPQTTGFRFGASAPAHAAAGATPAHAPAAAPAQPAFGFGFGAAAAPAQPAQSGFTFGTARPAASIAAAAAPEKTSEDEE